MWIWERWDVSHIRGDVGGASAYLWNSGQGQAHDFKSVSDDADGHELLAVIAAVHHEGICETLDDGAVGLSEALDGIATGGVRDIDGGADLDVVAV